MASLCVAANNGGPFNKTNVMLADGITLIPDTVTAAHVENNRAVAIGLALVLGPFGAHRLYLGTTPKVAIIYGLTLGGFGVFVLIDLIHLIVNKDLDRVRNNDRVFMWAGEPTPP